MITALLNYCTFCSFADLYERAVRNLLNIRPLFDSPLDIFGQKNNETSTQAHNAQENAARSQRLEISFQSDKSDNTADNSRKTNYKYSDIVRPSQSDYLSRANEQSSNGFFAQMLSEHARHIQPRHHQNRIGFGFGHTDRYNQSNGGFRPNNNTGHNGLGYSQQQYTARGEVLDSQREVHAGHNRFWSPHVDHGYRHKHRMIDGLRYHAKLTLSSETTPRKDSNDSILNTETDDKSAAKEEHHDTQKVDEIAMDNREKSGQEIKLTEKEQMDLIRERIIKENQKLKYRPYSLRSKRNGREIFKSGKKKSKKLKVKKKTKLRNLWKPSTPQEIFLAVFGLMKNMKEPSLKTVETEERNETQT